MSERTREAISANMSAQINRIQDTDFAEKAKKILSQEPLLSARDVAVTFSLRGNKLPAIRRSARGRAFERLRQHSLRVRRGGGNLAACEHDGREDCGSFPNMFF